MLLVLVASILGPRRLKHILAHTDSRCTLLTNLIVQLFQLLLILLLRCCGVPLLFCILILVQGFTHCSWRARFPSFLRLRLFICVLGPVQTASLVLHHYHVLVVVLERQFSSWDLQR